MAINLGGKERNSAKDWLVSDTKDEMQAPSAFRNLRDSRIYEPQRDNHFEFVVEFGGDDKLLRWGEHTEGLEINPDGYFDKVGDTLRVSLESAFLPTIGVGTINSNRGNSDIVFAGKPNIGHSGTLSFNDWIGARTYDICLAWFQLVYNQTTDKVGLAQDYKRTAYIYQYTPTWQLVRAWKLNGVFPTEVKGGDLSYANGTSQMKVSMTLSYDNFEIDYETLASNVKDY